MTWTPGSPVNLTSRRFRIRSITPNDIGGPFMRWQRDRDILEGLNQHRAPYTRNDLVKTMRRMDNKRKFTLIIEPALGGPPIGYFIVGVDPNDQRAETTIVIGDKNWWGKGVVTEARARLLDFLFDDADIEKVTGHPHGRNLASIFNYKSMGFRCEAVLKDHLKNAYGEGRLDGLIFAILADEWRQVRDKFKGASS